MHHNYIISPPEAHLGINTRVFLSCRCFRTSQKRLVFAPFWTTEPSTRSHPAVWPIVVPDMTTAFRARISAQQHQGGPPWPPLEHQSTLQRTIQCIIWHQRPQRAHNMKAPRLLKAINMQPLPSPHCAASPPPTPRMATHRREDLGVIWPAPPKPSTPGAASGRRSVLASLRLHVSWQLRVHSGAPRLPLTPPTCVWCRAVVGDAAALSCGGFALFLLSGGQKRPRFPSAGGRGNCSSDRSALWEIPRFSTIICGWWWLEAQIKKQ